MPCNDGGPSDYEIMRDNRKEIKNLEATLCAVLTVLENEETLSTVLGNADWNEAGVSRRSVEKWWKEHKREDEERRAREQEAARRKVIGKLTRDKLTPEEIRAIKDNW